ncbi:desulfurase [Jeongeupia sp. HS-3]|uniref:ABC transporter substrate-binding protein n=1 Tax=Jeongeupia sp. HS-3 TaxID=1009682 RepID=UPI0018A64560|nr:ABC transporter substrate-binding protein [Jeongeupia sp. HS-3]BCL74620.1 desulfurase [Jeongeupia sp. HS-3]
MTTSTTSSPDTLWFTRCPVPTPLGIAAHLGWLDDAFAAEPVRVRSLQQAGAEAVRHAHVDHSLANAFRQGGSIPAIWARAAGADTRVIGLSWIDESQVLLALPQAGIRDIADLRGKRIGLPLRAGERIDIFRAAALRGFASALSLADLSLADVELVDVPVTAAPADAEPLRAHFANPGSVTSRALYAAEGRALVRGEVDAIYAKGSLGLETAQLLGAQVITDIGFHPDPAIRINNGSPRPITVSAALLAERPDLVDRFLGRVLDVDGWARVNQKQVHYQLGRETGSTEPWLRLAYGDEVHERFGTGLQLEAIAALGQFKDFLLAHGFLPGDVDIAAWIDPAPLQRLAATTAQPEPKEHR